MWTGRSSTTACVSCSPEPLAGNSLPSALRALVVEQCKVSLKFPVDLIAFGRELLLSLLKCYARAAKKAPAENKWNRKASNKHYAAEKKLTERQKQRESSHASKHDEQESELTASALFPEVSSCSPKFKISGGQILSKASNRKLRSCSVCAVLHTRNRFLQRLKRNGAGATPNYLTCATIAAREHVEVRSNIERCSAASAF